MNYRLSSNFIELKEHKGLVENNSNGLIEIAIAKNQSELVQNGSNNIVLKPHGKATYNCMDGETAYARAVTHPFGSQINVLKVKVGGSSSGNIESELEDRLMSKQDAIDILNKYL